MCLHCTSKTSVNWHFCRAMLCISAAYAVMRCLSVCLSRSWIKNVKTNKDIFEIFSPSGSHTILVFSTPNGIAIRDPPNGGVECTWGRQKSRLWAYLALVPAVSAATCQVLSTGSPVDGGHRLASWHIAGSKRPCWLREKTTKRLTKSLTLRQRQQNSAFNYTQW